jgi:hypothetical protein
MMVYDLTSLERGPLKFSESHLTASRQKNEPF